MTIQKAIRVRSELKKEAAKLNALLDSVNYTLTWENVEPTEYDVDAKRNETLYALDGMTFAQVAQKLFAIIEECEKINIAIENVNKEGHILLYKESTLKSKLAFVESCLEKEHAITQKETKKQTYLEKVDGQLSNVAKDVVCYNFPILDSACFSKNLQDLRKELNQQIEDVRDKLMNFNATTNVDYTIPKDLL